jgi:hypothetical protein
MPSRRPTRSNRTRRQPPPRRVVPAAETGASAVAAGTADASTIARTRTRSRAPAQIVIGNYDFLRHDLRILGVLAPTLVVILVVLSFVIH